MLAGLGHGRTSVWVKQTPEASATGSETNTTEKRFREHFGHLSCWSVNGYFRQDAGDRVHYLTVILVWIVTLGGFLNTVLTSQPKFSSDFDIFISVKGSESPVCSFVSTVTVRTMNATWLFMMTLLIVTPNQKGNSASILLHLTSSFAAVITTAATRGRWLTRNVIFVVKAAFTVCSSSSGGRAGRRSRRHREAFRINPRYLVPHTCCNWR